MSDQKPETVLLASLLKHYGHPSKVGVFVTQKIDMLIMAGVGLTTTATGFEALKDIQKTVDILINHE